MERAPLPGHRRGQRRLDVGDRRRAPLHHRLRRTHRRTVDPRRLPDRPDALGGRPCRSGDRRALGTAQSRPRCAPPVPSLPLRDSVAGRRAPFRVRERQTVVQSSGRFPRVSRHRDRRNRDGRGAAPGGGRRRDVAARLRDLAGSDPRHRSRRHIHPRQPERDVGLGLRPGRDGRPQRRGISLSR